MNLLNFSRSADDTAPVGKQQDEFQLPCKTEGRLVTGLLVEAFPESRGACTLTLYARDASGAWSAKAACTLAAGPSASRIAFTPSSDHATVVVRATGVSGPISGALSTVPQANGTEDVGGVSDTNVSATAAIKPSKFSGAPSDTYFNDHTTPVTWYLVGDSNGVGSNYATNGHVGGWRAGTELELRKVRSDFDFSGAVATDGEANTQQGLLWHSCYAGEKIEDATAAAAARYAASASSSGVVDSIGTNNLIAGDDLATMQAKRIALDTALDALGTFQRIVVPPPPFVDGATTHASLAALQAAQVAYAAWLRTYCAAKVGYTFVDPASLGPGCYQADGVHLNRSGQMALGTLIASAIDTHMGRGSRRGVSVRKFRQRFPMYSIVMATASTDTATVAGTGNGNGYSPGSSSYAFCFDLYPTALDASALHTVAGFGSYGASGTGWWMISQRDKRLQVYWDKDTGTLGSSTAANYIGLKLNKWHRCLLLTGANGANSSCGLYINGRPTAIASGLPPWSMGAQTLTLGKDGIFGSGCVGNYGRVRSYRGSSVPRPGTMAALLAAEADYFDDAPIAVGAGGSYHELDNALADQVYGKNAFVLGGGTAFAACYPGASPIRPWEISADYP